MKEIKLVFGTYWDDLGLPCGCLKFVIRVFVCICVICFQLLTRGGAPRDQQQFQVPDSCFWYCASCSSPSRKLLGWKLHTVTPLDRLNLFQFQTVVVTSPKSPFRPPDQYVCLGAPSNLSSTNLRGVETCKSATVEPKKNLPKNHISYKDQTCCDSELDL